MSRAKIAATDISGLSAALSDPWQFQPLGVLIAVADQIAGLAPPTDQAYRYVKLTASDSYNTGFLISESVSGSFPAVQATAVVNYVGSLLHGATLRLINTERRFLRAGSAGTVEADAFLNHGHTASFSGVGVGNHAHSFTQAGYNGNDGGAGSTVSRASAAFGNSTGAAGAFTPSGTVTVDASTAGSTETRTKNLGVTYYVRIK